MKRVSKECASDNAIQHPDAYFQISDLPKEIIKFVRSHLAGFKTPKQVVFMELPKTATGKIQKFELREMAKKL